MARHFVAASQQYLQRTGVPVSSAPLTLSIWVNLPTTAQAAWFGTLANSVANSWLLVGLTNAADSLVRAYAYDGTTAALATVTTTIGTGGWVHVCGVFTSASARAAFLGGTNKGTDTATSTPASLDRTMVGQLYLSGAIRTSWFSGDLAEFAIWNAALSDAEVAQLAGGLAANGVRVGNLVAYYPLLGTTSPEPDVMGGTGLTLVNGPTGSTHPIITPANTGAGRMFQVF